MSQVRLLFAADDGVLNLVTVPKGTRPKPTLKDHNCAKSAVKHETHDNNCCRRQVNLVSNVLQRGCVVFGRLTTKSSTGRLFCRMIACVVACDRRFSFVV